jgi:glycosyltransferase involved in cell wall biosynthesis
MVKPVVSLVIRTHNEEENIGQCLAAVKRQTLQPSEVLIVDHESTDTTRVKASMFCRQLNLTIINNPIKGFASGLNVGVEESTFDLVAFLSADCFPDPNWLHQLVSCMQRERCAVAQGLEVPCPDNEIHDVLRTERPEKHKSELITYFYNTNTLYDKHYLLPELPFEGVGEFEDVEDIFMSLRYEKRGHRAFFAPQAVVYHNMFPSEAEFKNRLYKHGQNAVKLFVRVPKRPRLYLNSYYWALRELWLFLCKRDLKYLKVACWRTVYFTKGVVQAACRDIPRVRTEIR